MGGGGIGERVKIEKHKEKKKGNSTTLTGRGNKERREW